MPDLTFRPLICLNEGVGRRWNFFLFAQERADDRPTQMCFSSADDAAEQDCVACGQMPGNPCAQGGHFRFGRDDNFSVLGHFLRTVPFLTERCKLDHPVDWSRDPLVISFTRKTAIVLPPDLGENWHST